MVQQVELVLQNIYVESVVNYQLRTFVHIQLYPCSLILKIVQI